MCCCPELRDRNDYRTWLLLGIESAGAAEQFTVPERSQQIIAERPLKQQKKRGVLPRSVEL
jgi:hypothetical protein